MRWVRLGLSQGVLTAALTGIVWVGLHEAHRGYAQLQAERLAAQGASLKSSMEMLLRVGMSLEQFTGFTQFARTVREADPSLEEIRVLDAGGRVLFSEPPARAASSPPRGAPVLRVTLPLEERFADRSETVGRLELTMPERLISQRVHQGFQPLVTLLSAWLPLQALLLLATQRLWRRHARRWLGLGLGAGCLIMALVTSLALMDIYAEGLRQGTSSLAQSLAGRLNAVARMGLTFSELRGLDTFLHEYQRAHPDLGALALTSGGRVLVQGDPPAPGAHARAERARLEYALDLELTEGPWSTPLRLEVGAATGALHARLWHGYRNFLLLFVSLGLLGLLLLDAVAPLPRPGPRPRGFARGALARLRPLAFLGSFLGGLPLALIPGYVEPSSPTLGLPAGGAALLATVGPHAAAALALMLTERYVRHVGPRRWLGAAVLLSSTSFLLLACTADVRAVLPLRWLAGLGLGALAGGVHAVLASILPQGRVPQGAPLASAHHGGLVSGTALGVLWATTLGPREVFLLGGGCGLAALACVWKLPPPLPQAPPPPRRTTVSRLPAVPPSWTPRAHHLATLLVGWPQQLVRGGVLGFALPLLLAQRGETPEQIGPLLALHASGALLAHHLLPSRLLEAASPRGPLRLGLVGLGLGLLALALVDTPGLLPEAVDRTWLCAGAVGLLGLSQGLLHAPLEGLLRREPVASRAALFLHRVVGELGQATGPVLVGLLLLIHPARFQALGGLGVGVLLLGAGFSWLSRPPRPPEVRHA